MILNIPVGILRGLKRNREINFNNVFHFNISELLFQYVASTKTTNIGIFEILHPSFVLSLQNPTFILYLRAHKVSGYHIG